MRLLRKIFILSLSPLWLYGLTRGVAANIELLPLINKIKKLNTIIDIGSNKGQFILLILKFFPKIKIYSFEPIKEFFEKQKNLFNFRGNILFFNYGIGSKNKNLNFFITERADSSSFLTINKLGSYNNDYLVKEKRNIKIRNLDQILKNKNLKKPALIKIDVQGFELEVLKGAKQILTKVDYILLEVSKNRMYHKQPIEREIVNFLKRKKFKPSKALQWLKIKNTNFMQRDILFERNDN